MHPRSPRLNSITSLLQLRWLWLCGLGMAVCLGGTFAPRAGQLGATWRDTDAACLYQPGADSGACSDAWREKLSSPIAPNRFSISFDGGPWSRPTYARLEGDDPIDLSIVLDTRLTARVPQQEDLLEKMDQTIADLAPSFLHPRDHVSIYAIDCSAMDFVEDVPAESGQLKRAVDTALSTWTARRHGKKAACNPETHLWDLLAFVTDKLSSRSGWRAVLAVTDGKDKNSKRSLADLTALAQSASVAIFGLRPSSDGSSGFQSGSARALSSKGSRSPNGGPLSNTALLSNDDLLSNACELTGGMMLDLNAGGVAKTMQRFTQMLRERYILEFPRPPNAQPGKLAMSVRIDKINAFIRVTGDGVPVVDQPLLADSSSIHPEQQNARQVEVVPAESAPVAEARPEPAPTPVQQPEQQPAQQPSVAVSAAVPAQPPPTAPVVAQQPSPSTATPTLKVATKLTVEDVTVTDAQRKPVHGLERPDFTIKEDGKPQPIRDFEEHGAQRSQTAPPRLPANTYTNAQPANASAVNILLLDDVTTGLANGLRRPLGNLEYERQQAIQYLKRMPPGTQVAILQLGDGLHLVQGVTTDQAILLAAMNAVSDKPVDGAYVPPKSMPGAGDACRAANTQSQLVVEALDQAAAFLSGIRGRKNLIWFTPGIPWLTHYADYSQVPCLKNYTPQLHRAYGLFNEAQVVLYPVDPRGLPAGSFDASVPPPCPPHSACAGPPPSATQAAIVVGFPIKNFAEEASLQDMANATGGKAYYNRNDLDGAVEEAIATGADFYSLSYVPPLTKYDGQYHTIDVKVDRPKLTLQYRPAIPQSI
jgi:VWFA-related protein